MCEILDDLKMNFDTHHDIYLPAGQCWYMIYTLNFYSQKKKTNKKKTKNKNKKKQNTKKTSRKKFDVNTTVPRRARWDFRGVFDDSLFLYLEFDMNKYLKNWGNYEVLQIKLGD